MIKKSIIVAAVTTLSLAACAGPVTWQKPGASQEQWDIDSAQCKSIARTEADRDFRARSTGIGSPIFDDTRTHQSNMAYYEALKGQRRLFEECLARRGYRKSPPKKKE